MQREQSFSILNDNIPNLKLSKKADVMARLTKTASEKDSVLDLLSDSEDDFSDGINQYIKAPPDLPPSDALSHVNGIRQKAPSAGPSSGQRTVEKIKSPISQLEQNSDSDSDSDRSDGKKSHIPGEYDPLQFENLDVNDEIKDLFQFITKYMPQNLNLDFKFKPFIPDYIPAVGDIDAFIKINAPEKGLNGEEIKIDHLGLTVLDEPSATQSDPALLHLQLRASSINNNCTSNIVVKKVDNVERNSKVIDKWIKDINDLHKTKTSPIVKYTDPMPDLDDLMEQWPEPIDNILKVQGFPHFEASASLQEYMNIICSIFDIPLYKNKIQSLHLLFSLYAAIQTSQLYQATNFLQEPEGKGNQADQLVLD